MIWNSESIKKKDKKDVCFYKLAIKNLSKTVIVLKNSLIISVSE